VSPMDVLRLYRARLRARSIRAQEGFAVLGIAVGVALLFASQVASSSLSHTVEELTGQVVGSARWELSARGAEGMSQGLLAEIRRLPVSLALPLVEGTGVASGPDGSRSVELLGTNPRQAQLAGTNLGHFSPGQVAHAEAVALPVPLAEGLGVETLEPIRLQLGGSTRRVVVGTTFAGRQIGGLIDSPLVFVPLIYAQKLTGMQGRLSRIFVSPKPGEQRTVWDALQRLAATSHLNLEPARWESRLFATAVAPQEQGETVFSAVAALVGFLLAAQAILITVPSRRRLIEDLRLAGATRAKTVQIMLTDAVVIGVLACVLGLLLGDVLSRTLFAASPGYLSFAFPVGNARIVTVESVVISVAAGLAAALTGVLWPLRDMLSSRTQRSTTGTDHLLPRWRLAAGGLSLAAAVAILLARPASATLGAAALTVALMCLIGPIFDAVLMVLGRLQRSFGGAASMIANLELANPLTRVRSLAIVATAAVAVFGVLALAGGQANLERGLDQSAREIDSGAQVWITPAGENNAFATTPISDATHVRQALARVPGIASIGEYGGSFLNWGPRRLWVLAPPASYARPLPTSRLLSGDIAKAAHSVRHGDGVLLSDALAAEHGLHVGQTFTLPTPIPIRLRLVGLTTNLGWSPGSIILSARNFRRGWGDVAPSAFQIQPRPGASAELLSKRIVSELSGAAGLSVETLPQRQARHYALASQGLSRLTQIRWLMVIAAVLAITGALTALLWQRRDRIANMRTIGSRRRVLWRALCDESAILLGTGCATGAAFGILGQLIISHALGTVTGFPVAFNIEVAALAECLVIGALAGIVAAGIGYPVVSVPPSTASPAY